MIAVISAANAASIVLLVHLLVSGSHEQARLLLRAGVHMWCMNVLLFALWYWQLDGGGPLERRLEQRREPDFLFPQQTLAESGGTTWQPSFVDYLFVSYTNATAFSPTDTLPLSHWAKLLMIAQSRDEPPAGDHGRRARGEHPPAAHVSAGKLTASPLSEQRVWGFELRTGCPVSGFHVRRVSAVAPHPRVIQPRSDETRTFQWELSDNG